MKHFNITFIKRNCFTNHYLSKDMKHLNITFTKKNYFTNHYWSKRIIGRLYCFGKTDRQIPSANTPRTSSGGRVPVKLPVDIRSRRRTRFAVLVSPRIDDLGSPYFPVWGRCIGVYAPSWSVSHPR